MSIENGQENDYEPNSSHKGTPPTGCKWGERTIQTCRKYTAPKYWKSDAYEMRQKFGISKLDPSGFEYPVWPDIVIHEKKPKITRSPRGTDFFATGDRGSGKTTFGLQTMQRVMEGDDIAIWRGNPERSGWLPFKHWATVFLPKNAEIDLTWMNEDDNSAIEPIDDIEDVVRKVIYYDDPIDLLEELGEGPTGSFNVVYPDPSFNGCEDLTADTDRIPETLRFRPAVECDEGETPTPLVHWWFAFLLARTEYGPFKFMTLLFDEVGDLLPENAKEGEHQTYSKIKLTRSLWSDSRRRLLSIFAIGHYEENVHSDIRREFKWRIKMPDGAANPRDGLQSSHPIGFKTIPMYADIMSDYDEPGVALAYNQSSFTHFTWEDIPPEPEDENRWLKVDMTALPVASSNDEEETTIQLEYDEKVFSEWQNSTKHRLYVNDPGNGWVSVTSGEVGEALESPIDGLEFVPQPVESEDSLLIRMRGVDDDSKKVDVARIPKPKRLPSDAISGVGETA